MLLAGSLACNYAAAQSVSFSHPGMHIPRKIIKKEKSNKQQFEGMFDDMKANISDKSYVAKMKKQVAMWGFDSSMVKLGNEASIDDMHEMLRKNYRPIIYTREALREAIGNLKDSLDSMIIVMRSNTQDAIISFYKQNSLNPDTIVAHGNSVLADQSDIAEQRVESFRQTKYLLRRNNNSRDFFPAKYSQETISFFTSKDTLASKFFNDNSLVFNSTKKKLGYSSEAYCDYFGPIRVGIGYTITSASSDKDTSEAKNDAVQKIMSNGGNLNYNVSYPLMSFGNGSTFSFKAYLSTKGGVDIPKDSAAASTYGFLTSSGMVANLFTKGYTNVMQIFLTSRIAYIYGNKNFENHLNQNSFWLWQNSLGIAIKDKFRVRLDYYNGLSGADNAKFVNENFPVTVSFDIVNPF